jgi:hypothetical protein
MESHPCPSCAAAQAGLPSTTYVYALGRIEPRFPSLAIEKEVAQAIGRADTAGLTDRETLHRVLAQRKNRYLARQLCWVLTIEGMETYVVRPGDPGDLELLIEALRPAPQPTDVDVVIGVRGPIAPPEMCNGLTVPMVAFSQMYSFDKGELLKSIPRPADIAEKEFTSAADELFSRIMQMTDNAGATDEHRALNYAALRYPAIYARAAEELARNFSLTKIDVVPSALGGEIRKIVEIIFVYTNRNTDFTEKLFLRVDVTEEFPFLVTKLSPYVDRGIHST